METDSDTEAQSPAPSNTPDRHPWAVLLMCVVGLALLVQTPSNVLGFPLDDAWIHQLVGRNLVDAGVLGYPGQKFAAAATSVLWALLQSPNFALFHVPPPLYSFGLNAVLYTVSCVLVYQLGLSSGLSRSRSALFASLMALSANFTWFVVSGMEASLLVCLSVAAIALWTRGRVVLTGVSCGLIFLTRPETGLLPFVLLALAPLRSHSVKRLVQLLAPFAALVLGYMLLMYLAVGSPLPETLSGRRWLWFQDVEGLGRLQLAQRFVLQWVHQLSAFQLRLEPAALFWPLAGLALAGLMAVLSRPSPLRLLVVWGCVHAGVYMVLLPSPGHGGRYQPFIPGLFLPLAVLAWQELPPWSRLEGRVSPALVRLAPWLLPLLLSPLLLSSLVQFGQAHQASVQHVINTEVAMGKRVAALPPDAQVASFDIGGIRYFADREVMDLGGLADRRTLTRIIAGQLPALLKEKHITHLVLPVGYNVDFPDPWNFYARLGLDLSPSPTLSLIDTRQSDEALWQRSMEGIYCCSPVQRLYEVQYP